MPGSKRKRSFTKKKRFFKKRFSSSSSSSSSSAFSSKAKSNEIVSKLSFKSARFTRQPLPDRFFTWLQLENQGAQPAGVGSNTGTYGFAINDIVTPLNKPGPAGFALQNPVVALNLLNPQGLKNLLFNGSTNTGIYTQFRVWTCIAKFTFIPGSFADGANIAMAPLASAASAYTSLETLSSAPNAVTGTASNGGSGASQSIEATWSMPALYGIPKTVFPAFASAIGTAGTPPGLPLYAQIAYRDDANQNLVNIAGTKLQVMYHVEFCNRADATLLNS